MGGITFYLFIVLTFTGVLLMFYYHPTKADAFQDILYLEHDVPFGKLLRNMHRWAAHLMVITTWLHMFRVVLTGSDRKSTRLNSSHLVISYAVFCLKKKKSSNNSIARCPQLE